MSNHFLNFGVYVYTMSSGSLLRLLAGGFYFPKTRPPAAAPPAPMAAPGPVLKKNKHEKDDGG